MANNARMAILRAKVEGVVTDLMIKSNVENVYFDENTTLAAKLAEIVASVGTKASTEALNTGLAAKAEKVHTHEQADVTGLVDALAARPTTDSMNSAISAAIDALIDGAPETYNTLKEIATYISEHQDVVTSINNAIGQKADKTEFEAVKATVNALGSLASKSVVSESDLDAALAEKVNAAAEGNHSHANKALLDTYTQTEANLADAVAKKHEHSNKTVLDGITAANIASWNGKAKVYAANETADLAEGEIFVQLI